MQRLGTVPRDSEARIALLESSGATFDDLDGAFYDSGEDYDALMLACARKKPSDFYFDGEVQRAVLRPAGQQPETE